MVVHPDIPIFYSGGVVVVGSNPATPTIQTVLSIKDKRKKAARFSGGLFAF